MSSEFDDVACKAQANSMENPVPKRVQDALEAARDFGDFRSRRVFRFLHLFSGPKDVLGLALMREAEKEGIVIEVKSCDKLGEPKVDLLEGEPYVTFVREARDDQWDGGHAGFPCGSFSRARLRKGSGPPPVRSNRHMYGLPGLSTAQQTEADIGTILAVRSVVVVSEILESQKRRLVAQVGTLENPPGSDTQEEGPAWILPEIVKFLEYFDAEDALFNTCSFQSECRVRWFKPGRISGRMEGLKSLEKPCNCPPWIKHEALVGKEMTSRAAEYPRELCDAYARNAIAAFKQTLQLEWWRFLVKRKSSEVNDLQRKWLDTKEKKHQGHLQEGPSKRIWSAEDILQDMRPNGDAPSKKRLRESENVRCIGGMRNPGLATSRVSKLQSAGKDVARLWERFYAEHSEAKKTAEDYGSAECRLDEATVASWKAQLTKLWRVRQSTELVMKEPWEFSSPLDPDLWQAWFNVSGDPEKDLVSWIRRGAPLGMNKEIEYSGIFPLVEDAEREEDMAPELEEQLGIANYKSFTEEPEHAKIELSRLLDKGFCMIMDGKECAERFGRGTVSRLALLVKEKEGGVVKRRIIMDLRRSGGNDRCVVRERIVLPRGQDVVEGLRFLHSQQDKLKGVLLEKGMAESELEADEEWKQIELFTADLSDAYCHLAVHPSEVGNCVAPGLREGQMIVFTAVLFGYKGAPLLMGRLSAAMARLWQAMVPAHEMQLQVCMDDPLVAMQGPVAKRNQNLALLLYTSAALGINIAYHKGARGSMTSWIGIQFEVNMKERCVLLSVPQKMASDVLKTLESWGSRGMVAIRELRAVTGKLSWISGIIPRAKWCTSICYAVIAAAEKEEKQGINRRDGRQKEGLVHVKRVELPRVWFMALLSKAECLAVRKEPLTVASPAMGIVTDAFCLTSMWHRDNSLHCRPSRCQSPRKPQIGWVSPLVRQVRKDRWKAGLCCWLCANGPRSWRAFQSCFAATV